MQNHLYSANVTYRIAWNIWMKSVLTWYCIRAKFYMVSVPVTKYRSRLVNFHNLCCYARNTCSSVLFTNKKWLALYDVEAKWIRRNGLYSPKCVRINCTVRMNEMPRFFIIRKYDWFISQRTSQLQIRSKSF